MTVISSRLMARPRPRRQSNPDLRRRSQMPQPTIEAIEATLMSWLTPRTFKPLKDCRGRNDERLRSRLLTLPVMVAIVLSLVYRQIPSLRELLRVLQLEGLLWVAPLKVSLSALSKRLRRLPARLFTELFVAVKEQIDGASVTGVLSEQWQQVNDQFPTIWIADGSTLEALRKRLKIRCTASPSRLAGKMMMVVELLTLRPVKLHYDMKPEANDKAFCDWLMADLPVGGLMVFDLGFFKFGWFDEFTQTSRYFVTRLREKTAYTTTQILDQGPRYRDEIITLGKYRSNPCEHPVRLVSVLWNNTWYTYLTNVLDPTLLSAEKVCDLYRRRWRIEDAFNLTKRLLGLAYVWTEDSNGVEIQIVATWILYAVLNQLCAQVAVALRQPIETISMEMVFRSLYHYAQARRQDPHLELIPFLTDHAKLLGLVKATRKRHRLRDAQLAEIWDTPP